MPAGDGRGPVGSGPMTGRGAGFCAGYTAPGYANSPGWGGYGCYGRGVRGTGMGRRGRFNAAGVPFYGRGFQGSPYGGQYEYSAEAELRMLKDQADSINERIRALESAAAKKESI